MRERGSACVSSEKSERKNKKCAVGTRIKHGDVFPKIRKKKNKLIYTHTKIEQKANIRFADAAAAAPIPVGNPYFHHLQ